jgi:hypothetical protein
MRKAIDIVLKVILSLILILPILGVLRVFPPPTPDLYNTLQAFEFIETLEEVRYISIIMAVVHVIALVCIWTGRMAAAALLILPITVNVVAFHLILDGGLHKAGAIPGDVMLSLNGYFLWQQRSKYRTLFAKDA